jgi:hypothetical protein
LIAVDEDSGALSHEVRVLELEGSTGVLSPSEHCCRLMEMRPIQACLEQSSYMHPSINVQHLYQMSMEI